MLLGLHNNRAFLVLTEPFHVILDEDLMLSILKATVQFSFHFASFNLFSTKQCCFIC